MTAHAFFDEARADRAPLETPSDYASRLVTAIGADLGVVFDRAGSACSSSTSAASRFRSRRRCLLFVRLLVEAGRTGTIAVPVTVTSQVDRLVEDSGLEVVRTPHSLSDLTRAAARDDVIFAGAVGGGYVFPDVVPGYDAVGEPLQAARAARHRGSAGVRARRRAARAVARPPLAAVPVGAQGARHAPAQRAAGRPRARPPRRDQGVRRARLGAGAARPATSRSCTCTRRRRTAPTRASWQTSCSGRSS